MKNYNINTIFKLIEAEEYVTDKTDNMLLLKYLKAKQAGTYGCIDYGEDGNGCADKTLQKDAILIRQALNALDKPFHNLTRDDIIELRNALKNNDIKAKKYKRCPGGGSVKYETELSYRSKRSILGSLRQFWMFYQEYVFNNSKEHIPNIFERILIKKPKETEHRVDYLNSEQIKKLMTMLSNNEDLRFLIAVAIDQAPRPIELANIRRRHFIYEKGRWWCKLPSIKGCSGRKHKNEVLFEKAFIERRISKLAPDDFLFDYVDTRKPFPDSSGCYHWNETKYMQFVYTVRYYTKKVVGKRLTPYMFRKSSVMYWLGVTENDLLWVQKRAGHVEGSDQIKHYMALQGIKTPVRVLDNIKKDKYESVGETMMGYEEEINSNKLKMEQMQSQMQMMQKQFLDMVSQIPKINAVDNSDLIRQTIEIISSQKKVIN